MKCWCLNVAYNLGEAATVHRYSLVSAVSWKGLNIHQTDPARRSMPILSMCARPFCSTLSGTKRL